MTTEAHQIAARLAGASEAFPIEQTDGWDSRASVSAEGDVLSIVVTDRLGRGQRRYRAIIECVAEDVPLPGQ
ncbi:hypothetical protein MARA_18500 [Mycolicibacterium arabiense]|uniref:Uncharacterized protein n=1 Tax=Mycolicibacterium arabiense TaxID=1286181 RepID=A0A7I7RUT3_9MYCO|nr:hypothetical protein [Mycolicibacterium arabiense]MCV7375236.1 hypothetical protein [Mycolicibacterium arabiense]BBY48382.1 hypothetical protein MARA_18500 [Mycolicibacterium arabiense]